MRSLSRVVWSEGMQLAQHHFQEHDRYFEDVFAFALANLLFEPYGFSSQELDAEALLNGTVSLVHARGIMPDGLPFNIPGDQAPEPLDVRTRFAPTDQSHVVLLAIGRSRGRYLPRERMVTDETTGSGEKSILVAEKSFRLVTAAEAGDDLATLPIARVQRGGSGHFVYDPEFVPPCVQIGASARLLDLLARLVEVLEAKAEALKTERLGAPGGESSREIATFWLAHAIHSSAAPLRHLLRGRVAHPELLYTEMARLAGALCTFSLHAHPRDLPPYDHLDLGRTFAALDRHVRQNLEVVLPTNRATIDLRRVDDLYHHGSVLDRRCLGPCRWFLGIRSSAPAADVVARVPRSVKICSGRHISRLVAEARPGLVLQHDPSPPTEISPRSDTHYFSVQLNGGCWDLIGMTGDVGIYVPAAFPDLELELSVALPG